MPGAKEGMDSRDPTTAEYLKSKRYATGQDGKDHLGDLDEHLPNNGLTASISGRNRSRSCVCRRSSISTPTRSSELSTRQSVIRAGVWTEPTCWFPLRPSWRNSSPASRIARRGRSPRASRSIRFWKACSAVRVANRYSSRTAEPKGAALVPPISVLSSSCTRRRHG